MIGFGLYDSDFNSAFINQFRVNDKLSNNKHIVRYHYTSPNALMSILKGNGANATLRFTDIRYMNDKSEQVYFVKVLIDYLMHTKKEYPAALEAVNQLLLKEHTAEEYINLELTEVEYSEIPDYPFEEYRDFVFCTSEAKDSLNMWNYYVKSGNYQGYNIGIKIYEFIKSFDIEKHSKYDPIILTYGKVIYKDADQKREVKLILDRIESYGMDDLSLAMAWLRYFIDIYSVFFKHKCFADEREYRIVIHMDKDQVNANRDKYTNKNNRNIKYDYFERNGILVPYLSVPLVKEAVDSIRVAPMVEYSIAKSSVEEFLAINNYGDVLVRKSDIPIRF